MKVWNKLLDFKERTDMVELIKNYVQDYSDIFSKVILFGSTARGNFSTNSDIDIYIESSFYTTTTLLRLNRFREFTIGLYSLFDNNFEFDLLSFGRNELNSSHNSILYKCICEDGVILYDDKGTETV